MSLAGARVMSVFLEISQARLLRACAAVARRKALDEGEARGWPLPAELVVHLQLRGLGLPA